VAIVYTSVTGNTKELDFAIEQSFMMQQIIPEMYDISVFPYHEIANFDILAIGTYTWGNGEIPKEMEFLYQFFKQKTMKHLVTGMFGTGDRFYPNFCGAVELFKELLFVKTNLAVTLKVELSPQKSDLDKCPIFIERLLTRLEIKN
jgi:flavodoxin I